MSEIYLNDLLDGNEWAYKTDAGLFTLELRVTIPDCGDGVNPYEAINGILEELNRGGFKNNGVYLTRSMYKRIVESTDSFYMLRPVFGAVAEVCGIPIKGVVAD